MRLISSIFILTLVSCGNQNPHSIPEPKIAKTVPSIYHPATGPLFSQKNDTVFYNHQLYSGYRFSLHDNNDTATLQSYFNGVEEGFQRKWYADHQLQEERFYINGKKEGTHKGWWPGGKKKFYFTVYNDRYNGAFFEWYASGLLGKAFHYRVGQEEGSERLWWDNGTVRANYVIRNGKKYGLIGLKTCVNPYDSIQKK